MCLQGSRVGDLQDVTAFDNHDRVTEDVVGPGSGAADHDDLIVTRRAYSIERLDRPRATDDPTTALTAPRGSSR